MTSDFRAPFELSPESMANNTSSHIGDEIFSILKMCHRSRGVVPSVDAQFTQPHTESASENRNGNAQNILQIFHYARVCTADVTDERKHTTVRYCKRLWTCKDERGSEKDVLLPSFAHHRARCGVKPLVWQFRVTDVVRMLNNSIDLLWSDCISIGLSFARPSHQ